MASLLSPGRERWLRSRLRASSLGCTAWPSTCSSPLLLLLLSAWSGQTRSGGDHTLPAAARRCPPLPAGELILLIWPEFPETR